jgi:sulfatase maturation enzyme AslB (radical SAM superfamily)
MFHAEIEATNHCNTRCLHCPHEVMTRPRGRMTFETFDAIVRQIRAHVRGEPYSLSFSGMGEPLLNPLLPRFIAHVAAEARTSFACNGALLTAENVRRLRDAGLDMIYVSFNGDEPESFGRMMGGLSFTRVRSHLRTAIELAQDSRLEIRANVSITTATAPRLTEICTVLRDEGVHTITFSQCHSRGGNLRDPAVCDTPTSPADLQHCAVIAHTLFIDWRGQTFICDHDLHGEHPLGDLMNEPLAVVLERRQRLIDGGVRFKICRECNDLLKGGFDFFADGSGGILSDWLYALHASDTGEPFAAATPAQRWLLQLFQRENRLDRAVDRLLACAQLQQQRLTDERSNREQLRHTLEEEIEHRDARIAALEHQLAAIRQSRTWRWREALYRAAALVRRTAHGEAVGRDAVARWFAVAKPPAVDSAVATI